MKKYKIVVIMITAYQFFVQKNGAIYNSRIILSVSMGKRKMKKNAWGRDLILASPFFWCIFAEKNPTRGFCYRFLKQFKFFKV